MVAKDEAFLVPRRSFLRTGGAAVVLAASAGIPAGVRAADVAMMDATPWTSDNAALTGAFAPVFDERDDRDLRVEGEIPPGLRGVFMRNGPNPMFQPDARYAYPFDGTGMVHAVYLEQGRARYRNRWVRTQELVAERQAGHRIYNATFGPPPHADLANTNIVRHGGRFLALYEGGLPYQVDREIETVGLFDYGGRLPGRMSAHPKIDPVTGELLSIAYDLVTGTLTYLRASRDGALDRVVAIPSPWPAMVHDIAITAHYVIACLGPLVFDWSRKGPPAAWEPERGAVIALVPRDATAASQVTWVKTAPFFQFHAMNAFEDGERIDLVVPWYDSFSLTHPASRLELHRLVIDPGAGTVRDEAIDDRACEFPRINDAHLGRRARYGYVGLRDPRPGEKVQPGAFEAFARYDLSTGQKTLHRFPAGVTVCEPVFVADPAGRDEADGFILSFAHDMAGTDGSFVILDARNLASGPLAVVRLPRRVPAGLHGSWIPT